MRRYADFNELSRVLTEFPFVKDDLDEDEDSKTSAKTYLESSIRNCGKTRDSISVLFKLCTCKKRTVSRHKNKVRKSIIRLQHAVATAQQMICKLF